MSDYEALKRYGCTPAEAARVIARVRAGEKAATEILAVAHREATR